jgi:hypothetical protein
MKYDLIEAMDFARAADIRMPVPLIDIFDDLHPGQSAEEVAEALIVAAGEIHTAETRCW